MSRHIEVVAVGVILALACGAGTVIAGSAPRDRVLQADGIELRHMSSIAVLPAVTVCENELAERRVEFGWVKLYDKAKTCWMPADEVRRRMAAASAGSGDLAAAVDAQIWRRGAVEAATARRLAQMLGVDAVLSLRIDRWEVADGGRGMVELTATLTGTDGAPLWSAQGLAGHGRGRLGHQGSLPLGAAGYWDPRLEPDECDHRTCTAFYTLLARWAPALPMPVYEQDLPPDLLAMVHGD